MAANLPDQKMDTSGDSGGLSPERMLEKYKEKYTSAISIAQKAKNARDEALKNNKILSAENANLKEKIKVLEKQYGTAEEMLGALTDQKLKLAMEIDDLKKQNTVLIEELKVKEKLEIEAESFKRQYNRLLKENEEIIKNFSSSEQESVQLRKELEDLKKNNNSMTHLFNNIQSEKETLDKTLKDTLEKLSGLEKSQSALHSALSQKLNVAVNDVKDWIEVISKDNFSLPQELDDKNLENEQKHISGLTITSVTKEKENLEQEIVDLNERIANIKHELNIANNDRDKMMNNLEKVGLETKQLIENMEKQTEEIECLKEEKAKQDFVINSLQGEKELLSKIITENEDEINRLCLQLREIQRFNEELILKMESLENPSCHESGNIIESKEQMDLIDLNAKVLIPEDNRNVNLVSEEIECTKEKCIKKEKSVSSELNKLQDELQVFSCEIGKYKDIADEFRLKYENAVKEILEKSNVISQQTACIDEFNRKIQFYEDQQKNLSNNLSECKIELTSALKDLSHAEEIKNSLQQESDLKDHKLSSALLVLSEKDAIITDQTKKVKALETELVKKTASLEDSNSEIERFKQESAMKQNEIFTLTDQLSELKDTTTKITEESKCKYLKCVNEILELKKIVNELEQCNETLSTNNTNLNKQLKELLNEQANDNNNLVNKLTCLQDTLQSQLKEKQSTIAKLESDITSLKSEVSVHVEQNKDISAENANLKTQIDSLLSKNTEEIAELTRENADLRRNLNSLLMEAAERDTNISNLKSDLENIKKVRDYIEKGRELLIQEKTHLSDLIHSTILCIFDINNKIESDIQKLKGISGEPKIPHLDTTESSMIIKCSEDLKNNQLMLHNLLSNILNLNESLLKENNSIKEQLNNLQTECSTINENLTQLQEYKVQLLECNKVMKELDDEKRVMTKQIEELISNNQSLLNEIKLKDSDCVSLQSQVADLETKLNITVNEREIELNEHQSVVQNLQDSLSKLNEKVSKYEEIENNLTNQKSDADSLRKQCSLLEEGNVNLKKQNVEFETAVKSLGDQLKSLQTSASEKEIAYKIEQERRDKIIEDYEDKLKEVNDKFIEISSLNENLIQDLSLFKNKLESLQSKYAEDTTSLLDKNKKLQEEFNNCKELLTFKALELKENNRIWAGRFSSLKIALIGLNKSRKEIKNQFECLENLFVSFMEQIKDPLQDKVNFAVQHSVTAAKLELINEMHQMNQALKERGEAISKMEFAISEYQAKLKHYTSLNENANAELLEAKEELKSLQECLQEKEFQLKQLESENEQLRESHYNTGDNDVLSTSTISKSEEYSRLKDVEDSFEDRYSKLKLLAVKMKKRIVELNQTLETEKSKMAAERAELQEKINSMSMAVKNAQKLQELFDQSLDECDELKKKNKLLQNSVEELKTSEESLKSKILTLENNNQNIPIMKKHIDSLNAVIKDSKAEIQKLQMENKAESIKYDELKKKCSKLETKIQDLTRLLEQAKQQGKNSNVLELEMKNYEKIVADLSSQLNAEKSLVKSLQNENEAISNTKVGLEEQITILEKQIEVEEERNHNTKEQLDSCRIKLEESSSLIEKLNEEIGHLQKQSTMEKNKTEALALEMSQVTSEFSKKELQMLSKIGTLQEQIRSLETSLQSTKQELVTSKREIDHLNEEYEGYKLRAQSILAKRKGEFVTHGEKEAKEEVERLKKDCTILEEKLEAYVSEIETLNTRISSMSLEKTRSDKKNEDLRIALEQKINDYDLLNSEFYNYKIANESTIENLKDELAKKKLEYQSELAFHKNIIDELALEFKQLEAKDNQNVLNKERTDNPGFGIGYQEGNPLPSEREDGEGSESVPSPKTRRHSSVVVPLDILLNNPIMDENKVVVLQEQVEKLRRELTSYEVRCRHLSSLLSEAEKDSARNLHQNKMLKEELRRLERSLERQPHVANTEYLKNVVFKFVTLPHGDERSRLVPVLDTLLKLSPEETHKLNSVAKGETQAGWSSYLQSWTGL